MLEGQGSANKTLFTPLYKLFNSSIALHSEGELEVALHNTCQCRDSVTLFPMLSVFETQDRIQAKYLNYKQRQRFLISVKEGCFFHRNGTKLQGELLYVLLGNHKLYAASVNEVSNHSHLSSGMPVLAAGFLYFYKGFLLNISNNSGHYKPQLSKMQHALDWFYKRSQNKEFVIEDHTQWKSGIKFRQYHLLNLPNKPELKLEDLAKHFDTKIMSHHAALLSQEQKENESQEEAACEVCLVDFNDSKALKDAREEKPEEVILNGYETSILEDTFPDSNDDMHYLIERFTGLHGQGCRSRYGCRPKIRAETV